MSKRHRPVLALAVALVAGLLFLAAQPPAAANKDQAKAPDAEAGESEKDGKDPEKKRPAPRKDLAAGEVVRIVIDALKHNDAKDTGIAITFDFASPTNRRVTGPLGRFIPLVKSPAYAPMLNHESAEYGKLLVRDDEAAQVVKVVDAKGDAAYYVFQLSKQAEGDYAGCWMTDGVVRVKPGSDGEMPKLEEPATPAKPDRA